MSRNLKITLAYDGSEFHGWQIQPGFPTVQGLLADCLGRITGENVLPQGSGRTDAGVHALAQVVSVRLNSPVPERNLLIALNDILPLSIRVSGVEIVDDNFHARHSATAKTYRYRIYRDPICPPFLARYVYHDPYPMDEDAMIRASEYVVGEFDFTSFAASDPERTARIAEAKGVRRRPEVRSNAVAEREADDVLGDIGEKGIDPDDENSWDTLTQKQGNVRTIYSLLWVRTPEEFSFTIRGNGFLHHMVRNLVGTFLQVGKESLLAKDMPAILAAKNRSAAGPTAPACGLYLVNVEYGPQ
ncbi:MAG: tRNA pseudouridine synthase A [Candidatus Korobacteraceae bacterium]